MIRAIQKIKGFGVFGDYTKSAATSDFKNKNIIFGWNYSGKTTLSRIFGALERKALHPDYLGAEFQITEYSGTQISSDALAGFAGEVRVFNSDFVEANLSWHGGLFNPILLLGTESKIASDAIAKRDELLKRCNSSVARRKSVISGIDNSLAEAKTLAARQIKQDILLVDAFTAIHLNQLINAVRPDLNKHILDDAQVADARALVAIPASEKPVAVPVVPFVQRLTKFQEQANGLLEVVPPMAATIEHLAKQSEIANWVELGLGLHHGKERCEFCSSPLSGKRLHELQQHFSKDLSDHKALLRDIGIAAASAKVAAPAIVPSQVQSQFRQRLQECIADLASAAMLYNSAIDSLCGELNAKIASPFQKRSPLASFSELEEQTASAFSKLNDLLNEHNDLCSNFESEKLKAVQALKHHYAARFALDHELNRRERKRALVEKHQKRLEKLSVALRQEISDLEAQIDLAQQGREQINARIADMLGSDSLKIAVIDLGEGKRFQLQRLGKIARNLSEGEKTTVAFAYFLTKLRELKALQDAVVFIDDPMSSLDSNHVFQVAALIRESFFEKAADGEWITKCKQVFLSTHNFEFFSLLRELPCSEKKTGYYFTKRLATDKSTLVDLPHSISKYTSEYHYLFNVIYDFHRSVDKTDIAVLLSIPNAIRRFVELYTYAKMPTPEREGVEHRAAAVSSPAL